MFQPSKQVPISGRQVLGRKIMTETVVESKPETGECIRACLKGFHSTKNCCTKKWVSLEKGESHQVTL